MPPKSSDTTKMAFTLIEMLKKQILHLSHILIQNRAPQQLAKSNVKYWATHMSNVSSNSPVENKFSMKEFLSLSWWKVRSVDKHLQSNYFLTVSVIWKNMRAFDQHEGSQNKQIKKSFWWRVFDGHEGLQK